MLSHERQLDIRLSVVNAIYLSQYSALCSYITRWCRCIPDMKLQNIISPLRWWRLFCDFFHWIGLISTKSGTISARQAQWPQTNYICRFQCILRRHITPVRVAEGTLEYFPINHKTRFHMEKNLHAILWPQYFTQKSTILLCLKFQCGLTVLERLSTL